MRNAVRRYVARTLGLLACLVLMGLAGCYDVNIDVGEEEDEVRRNGGEPPALAEARPRS